LSYLLKGRAIASPHAIGLAFGRQDVRPFGDTIQKGCGQLFITKDLDPLGKGQIRGNGRRFFPMALSQQIKEQLTAGAVKGHKTQFIDNQQGGPLKTLMEPTEDASVCGLVEISDQIGSSGKHHPIASAGCFHTQSDSQMGLSVMESFP
jgi:hypothetical protein